ncbi:hypothetical protein [Corallococcus sp. EGB]|uniref:hypothetical protein n=1 Tax=Corallococcus sp. EGB TaxID=1521117 RepID=UPI001CBBCA58|nr:hypothetical protein [Corallococcus sp. EGB]
MRDLTPFQGIRARMLESSPTAPRELLVTMNLRERTGSDIYRVSLDTGAITLDTQDPGDVMSWTADSQLNVRGALAQKPDGTTVLRVRDSVRTPWRTLLEVPLRENVFPQYMGFIGFSRDGAKVYLKSPHGSNTSQLVEKVLRAGAEKVLAEDAGSDVFDVLFHPERKVVQAVAFNTDGHVRWKVLDASLREDFEVLGRMADGDFALVSRDRADRRWVVAFEQDAAPLRDEVPRRPDADGLPDTAGGRAAGPAAHGAAGARRPMDAGHLAFQLHRGLLQPAAHVRGNRSRGAGRVRKGSGGVNLSTSSAHAHWRSGALPLLEEVGAARGLRNKPRAVLYDAGELTNPEREVMVRSHSLPR